LDISDSFFWVISSCAVSTRICSSSADLAIICQA
jgi:hypothetical protein